MQGHWATLSCFLVLELLVKAEGKGRWEKKADRSVITDQVSFGAMIEDVKFYCNGIRLG